MRLIILLLLGLGMLSAGTKSVTMTDSQGTATLAGAPWNNVTDACVTGRVHRLSSASSASTFGWIVQWKSFNIGFDTSAVNFKNQNAFDTVGVGGDLATAARGTRTDILFRVYRDVTNLKMVVETWETDGAAGYTLIERAYNAMSTTDFTGTFTFGIDGGANIDFDVAWLKVKVGTCSTGEGVIPQESDSADLDFRFEDTMTATTGGVTLGTLRRNGGAAWTPTYPVTTAYEPVVDAGAFTVLRAGNHANTITGTATPMDGNSTITYLWTQTAGPNTPTLTNTTTSTLGIRGTVFGEYTFQLQACQADLQCDTDTVMVGSTYQDDKGLTCVECIAGEDIAELIGPLPAYGKNQWEFPDYLHKLYGDYFGGKQGTTFTDGWNTALGTVTLNKATSNVTLTSGDGSNLRTTFCGAGTTPTVETGTGARIILWVPTTTITGLTGASAGIPGEYRRLFLVISSCSTDGTTLTLESSSSSLTQSVLGIPSGDQTYTYSRLSGTEIRDWGAQSNAVNYYDNVMGFASLYYRTGVTAYLTYARWLADKWITYPALDRGVGYALGDGNRQVQGARSKSLKGVLWRWMDAGGLDDEYLATLRRIWNSYIVFVNIDRGSWGERESGYNLAFLSHCVLYELNSTYKDTCRTALRTQANRWLARQDPSGTWKTFSSGQFSDVAEAQVTPGNNVVTRVAGDDWTITNFATNHATLFYVAGSRSDSSIGDSAPTWDKDNEWYYAKWINGTTLHLFEEDGVTPKPYIGPCPGAAASCNKAWHSYLNVGMGTNTFMLGISGVALHEAARALDPTHPSEAEALRDASDAAMEWIRTTGYDTVQKGLIFARGYTNCEPVPSGSPIHAECTYGTQSSRYIAAEVINAISLSYLRYVAASSPQADVYADWMDEMYTATFGKVGYDLPSGITGDGIYVEELDGTASGGTLFDPIGKAKNFGFHYGFAPSLTWAGIRLGDNGVVTESQVYGTRTPRRSGSTRSTGRARETQ